MDPPTPTTSGTAATTSTASSSPASSPTTTPSRRTARRRIAGRRSGGPLGATFTVNHAEYGPPVPTAEVVGATGPGAFCNPPWTPDLQRLSDDVNELFRCILSSGRTPGPRNAALRRALLDFHLLGRMGMRLPRRVWESILQLTDGQSGPLRAVLREADARCGSAGPDRYVPGPYPDPAPIMYGGECEVSSDEEASSDDETSELDDPTFDISSITSSSESSTLSEEDDEDESSLSPSSPETISSCSTLSDDDDDDDEDDAPPAKRRRSGAAE
uniref:Immediate early protein n=1 Tax=Anatid alphaherpesvirus 2 TaxID=3080522 RepID=A0AAU0K7Z4_9ALPH